MGSILDSLLGAVNAESRSVQYWQGRGYRRDFADGSEMENMENKVILGPDECRRLAAVIVAARRVLPLAKTVKCPGPAMSDPWTVPQSVWELDAALAKVESPT
jgi:hypothetical protein